MFSLICEPISLSCGHSYCRLCLIQSLARSKKQCPVCRAVCHLNVETAPENIMIKNLALKLNPDTYNLRAAESAQALADHKESYYPMFFYMECLFPGTRLKLHLFEPRYKLMMQRVVNASRTFAYAPYSEHNCREGALVLIFHLEECEFLPDGRCLIDGKIKSRAKVTSHHVEEGTQHLHYCNAIIFQDEPISDGEKEKVQEFLNIGRFLSSQLLESASPDGFSLRSKIEHKYGPIPSNDELFSLWLTAIVPLPENQKVALLSTTNTLQRLEVAVGSMIHLMQHVDSGSGPRLNFMSSNVNMSEYNGDDDSEEEDDDDDDDDVDVFNEDDDDDDNYDENDDRLPILVSIDSSEED